MTKPPTTWLNPPATPTSITWLEAQAAELGTPEQREMHKDGRLTDEAIRELAREELFRPLEGFLRWKNRRDLHAREVEHLPSCAAAETRVRYTSHEISEATAPATWVGGAYRKFRHATNEVAVHPWLVRTHTVVSSVLTAHTALCTHCKASRVRYSVKVAIPWCGRDLVREYAL